MGFEREYLESLMKLVTQREEGRHFLVLFWGSLIGNFHRTDDMVFLRELRGILQAGDSLLLGTDLEKSDLQLVSAYDDEAGVIAAFNLNLLVRINRELKTALFVESIAFDCEPVNTDQGQADDWIKSRTGKSARSKLRSTLTIEAADVVI